MASTEKTGNTDGIENTEKFPKVLFLCTGNSCRSQMAEGFANAILGDQLQAVSAGIEKHGINYWAARVMAEIGVNIAENESNTLDELDLSDVDLVVTVCANAHETCPIFPGSAKVVHVAFDDPPGLTKDIDVEKKILPVYRRVRDEIRQFVEEDLLNLL